MTFISSWRQPCLYALFMTALIDQAAPFRILSTQLNIPFTTSTPPNDLHDFVRPGLVDTTGVYKHALEILSTAQASPSCYRVATSDLLESCHSIDGSTRNVEHNAEQLKSIYAARLALCEIQDADSPPPQPCKSLATTKTAGNTAQSNKQLNACLQALESRPQWWTSYSNSKQNAVALCKAVRADIDKDDMIKLHKQMVETQTNTHGLLAKTTESTYHELATLKSDFEQARHAFQERLEAEIATSTRKTGTYLNKLASGVGAVLDNVLGKVRSANDAIESQSAKILASVERANTATRETETNIGKIFSKVVAGSSELAHIQTSQWDTSRDVADDLLASMRSIQDVHVITLVQTMRDVGSRLDNSNELIARMHDRQSNIEERMFHLTNSFASLESGAAALTATQVAQAETQARLHSQMEVDMQVAQGYLTDVAKSALRLQQTITDTATKIQNLTGFAKMFTSVFDWVATLLMILMLVFVVFVTRCVWRLTPWGGMGLIALTVFIGLRDFTPLSEHFVSFSSSTSNILGALASDIFLLSSILFGTVLCAALTFYVLRQRARIGNKEYALFPPPSLVDFFRSKTSQSRGKGTTRTHQENGLDSLAGLSLDS